MALDIDKVYATTIDNWSKTLADNVTAHNAALNFIKQSGNVQTFDGGIEIREAISYKENSNAGSYSGADPLSVNPQDNQTAAVFPWAQYAVTLPVTGRQMLTNSGKAQMIDLLDGELENAETSLMNVLNRHIYLDGTGNSNKNIIGFAAAVPVSPTNVYGGIDRDTLDGEFWKNKVLEVGDGTANAELTPTNVNQYFSNFVMDLTRGVDRPNVVLAGRNVYAALKAAATNIKQLVDVKTASLSFKAVDFEGIPVIFDHTTAGLDPDTAYFLNTKYLKWRPHKDRNFVPLDDKDPYNQDLVIKSIVWAGQLTCKASFLQGVFVNHPTTD